MRFYKKFVQDSFVYSSREDDVSDSDAIEITQEEYDAALTELEAKRQLEQEQARENEQTQEEYIAELEAENAALLYQILTGEEYSNV